MSHREAFLTRVRQAAGQGRRYRIHGQDVPQGVAYIGAGGDLCARFAAEVNAVGGKAFLVHDAAAAGEQLRSLLSEAGAASAVVWQHELLDRLKVNEILAAGNIAALACNSLRELPLDQQRSRLLDCDVGITSCDCAIAETGTLMMCSAPGRERVASLTPPLHVALVERRQIVPDLIDAFELLTARGRVSLPSNVTFITGPSKTGDIELQLTTGVHGPGQWRVIVLT